MSDSPDQPPPRVCELLSAEQLAEVVEHVHTWEQGKGSTTRNFNLLLRHTAALQAQLDAALAEVDRTQSAQDACFRKLTETIAEVDRLKAERERDETCIVCSALLLTDTSEPPHCVNCQVTDEDRERWEDSRPTP